MAARRLRKLEKEKELAAENSYLIDRIAKARSNSLSQQGVHSELSTSRSKSIKRSNHSMLLPAIDPNHEALDDPEHG